MTLHWWMHWFWVTAHFSVILCVPIPSTTNEPLTDRNSNMAQRVMFVRITTPVPENSSKNTEEPFRSSLRIAKAISSFEPSIKINTVSLAGPELPKQTQITSRIEKYRPETNQWYQAPTISSDLFLPTSDINKKSKLNHFNIQRNNENIEIKNDNYQKNDEIFETRKNTRITWILTTSRPKRRRTNENENLSLVEKLRNFTDNNGRDLTVLPLRVEETRFKVIVNTSQTINNDRDGISISSRTLNRSENIEIDREFSDPSFSAQTGSPVLQASIGELTRERLNRARLSSSDFQSEIAEDRSSHDSLDRMDDMDDVVDGQSGLIGGFTTQNSTMTVFNIAAITGSCLALIVLVSTIGSLGFLMYRRKYLNPPQTLNSDKCSNPDSSGYIDDTTIRDNSEEMYSLDNDSFLNSLEAMTIQNYWTDSVKHTKL